MDNDKNVPVQESEERSDDQISAEVMEWFKSDRDWRALQVDKQWMVNRAYYEGKQNFRYDRVKNQLVQDNNDPLKFYINLVRLAVRTLRNAIVKDQPIWDISGKAHAMGDDETNKALAFFMTDLYDELGLDKKVKQGVTDSLLFGRAIFQYGFDADLDPGLWVDVLNPFDVYFGGQAATSVEDADRITKVIRKSFKSVKENPDYRNTEDIHPDNKTSSSEHERQLEKTSANTFDSNEDGTILVHETWAKEVRGDEITVTVTTFTETGVVLRHEDTDFDRLPFVTMDVGDVNGKMYGDGWVKDIVPLNKAINYEERKILKYVGTMSAGKYVTDSNSNIETITNESGEIIKKAPGSMFEQLRHAPMGSTPFNQISNLMRYFQDISGAQEAFLGRAPSGVTAGIAFEQLAANAFGNMSEIIDGVTEGLEELGTEMLKLAADRFVISREVVMDSDDSESKVFKVVGKEGIMKGEKNVVVIPEEPNVKVTIVSESEFTKPARRETMMSLYERGAIDRRTLHEQFDLNHDEIEARLAVEQQQGAPIPSNATAQLTGGDITQDSDAVAEFVAQAQEAGLQIDPALTEEMILAIMDGQVEVDQAALEQGVLTVVQ